MYVPKFSDYYPSNFRVFLEPYDESASNSRNFQSVALLQYLIPLFQKECHQICPSIVYPTAVDRFPQRKYYSYEREMWGGPFGKDTLNPFYFANGQKPMQAGFHPGIDREVVPVQKPQIRPPNSNEVFLQVSVVWDWG